MVSARHRPDPDKSLVGFRVGDVHYAVPIGHVREIVNPLPVVGLPHAPRAVIGVADHRGEVVPIIDLRQRFGLPPHDDPERAKWILVDVSGRAIGLRVDQVTEVFGTGGGELRPAPELGGGDDTRGIVGVTAHEDGMVFVLDVQRFEHLTEPLAAAGALGDGRSD
ncbi:MAG: purine-binding chemotaxis protein CheW [Polyangiaceae bacterium]|nr:purine-binding chemotaxis protein CheW [Polyangiaceae bacterium]